MTIEAATAFIERLKSDEAFQSELARAESAEEKRAIAKQAGFDLSADDLPAIKAALGIENLSDEDLEQVAGGTGAATVGASVAITATVMSMYCAAVAVAAAIA